MFVDGTLSIISHDIDGIGFDLPWGKVPIIRVSEIRFPKLFAIDEEFSTTKFDFFAFESNHSLQKGHLLAGKTDYHHISPFGF